MFFFLVFVMPLCASVFHLLFFKGLTSWLPFVVYKCDFVTFPLVSWVSVSIPDLCNLTLTLITEHLI